MESIQARIKRLLIEIGDKYNSSVYDRNIEIESILLLCDILQEIHNRKSKTYGASWKRRGWVVSIFGNIARKFDRLEKIFTDTSLVQRFIENPNVDDNEESIVDTLADGAIYHLLALSEVMLTKPKIFNRWLEKQGLTDQKQGKENG